MKLTGRDRTFRRTLPNTSGVGARGAGYGTLLARELAVGFFADMGMASGGKALIDLVDLHTDLPQNLYPHVTV